MYSQKQIRITAILLCAIYGLLCVILFTVGAELHWSGKIILMCSYAFIFAFLIGHLAWEFKEETGVNACSLLFGTGKRKHKTHKKDSHTYITILESR